LVRLEKTMCIVFSMASSFGQSREPSMKEGQERGASG